MKAKKSVRRRGRSRKLGMRQPNGRLNARTQAASNGPIILDATIEQRARLLGKVMVQASDLAEGVRVDITVPAVQITVELRRAMRDEHAGYPLGRLLLTGRITDRQFRAGNSYGMLRRRWERLAGAPKRHAGVARLPIASENPEDMAPQIIDILALERESDMDGAWLRAKLHVRGVHRMIGDLRDCRTILSVLEAVCVDEATPPCADWLPLLRDGLDAVADHFRLAR